MLDRFQATLFAYEPASEGQKALHTETLRAFNNLIEFRRMRLDQVGGGLSAIMWFVIWVGAAISISVGYFYKIEDPKLHTLLVGLTAAFLGIVLFMVMINDRPFAGDAGVSPPPINSFSTSSSICRGKVAVPPARTTVRPK